MMELDDDEDIYLKKLLEDDDDDEDTTDFANFQDPLFVISSNSQVESKWLIMDDEYKNAQEQKEKHKMLTDTQKQKQLDLYIHDYMIRKNMVEAANIFATEANVDSSTSADQCMHNTPEALLTNWWSIIYPTYCSRVQNSADATGGGSTSMATGNVPQPDVNFMAQNVSPAVLPSSSDPSSSLRRCASAVLSEVRKHVRPRSRTLTRTRAGLGELPRLEQTNKQEDEEERAAPVAQSPHDNVEKRYCSHCQTDKTPQWRAGPMGPATLCNACGVRHRLGRLVPEYRPASSPTFSNALHSSFHRQVVEMRKQKQLPPGDGMGG